MAPFKKERGERPKVTRHTLYSHSHTTGDGYVITNQVINEITIVPPDRKIVRPLEQGDGRRSDRRQALLWEDKIFEEAPPASQVPWYQKEAGLKCDDDALGLYGSPTQDKTATTSPELPSTQPTTARSHSRSMSQPMEPTSLESSAWSPTSRQAWHLQGASPPSPISNQVATGSDDSSEKSSAPQTKFRVQRKPRIGLTSSSPPDSSSCELPKQELHSPILEITQSTHLPGSEIPGSGAEPGYSAIMPPALPKTSRRPSSQKRTPT